MIFFASDVHLASDTPAGRAITARFLNFLEGARREASAVYLLGDIFESWVGDEDLGLPEYQAVFAALRQTVDAGVVVQELQHFQLAPSGRDVDDRLSVPIDGGGQQSLLGVEEPLHRLDVAIVRGEMEQRVTFRSACRQAAPVLMDQG